jgi:hypothetical protein
MDTYERRSFSRDFIFVCSLGLNVGFIVGLVLLL